MIEHSLMVVKTEVEPLSNSRTFHVKVIERDTENPGHLVESPVVPFSCEVEALKNAHGGSWGRYLIEHVKPTMIGRHQARHHNRNEAEAAVGKEL